MHLTTPHLKSTMPKGAQMDASAFAVYNIVLATQGNENSICLSLRHLVLLRSRCKTELNVSLEYTAITLECLKTAWKQYRGIKGASLQGHG